MSVHTTGESVTNQSAVQCLQCPVAAGLASELAELRDALADIALGAAMMLDIPGNPVLHRYASEVRRVAKAHLSDEQSHVSGGSR